MDEIPSLDNFQNRWFPVQDFVLQKVSESAISDYSKLPEIQTAQGLRELADGTWYGKRFPDIFLHCLGRCMFIAERNQVATDRVLSLAVIKHFDILKNCMLSLFPRLEILMVYQLGFQCMEEAFGHCIIPAVTLATHAADGLVFSQQRLITFWLILTASISDFSTG